MILEREPDDIAGQCGVTKVAVLHFLRKFDIPIRSKLTHWPQLYWVSVRRLRGKDNPRWKDEEDVSTPGKLYMSRLWKDVKQKVFERESGICQKCKEFTEEAKCHHIVPAKWGA